MLEFKQLIIARRAEQVYYINLFIVDQHQGLAIQIEMVDRVVPGKIPCKRQL